MIWRHAYVRYLEPSYPSAQISLPISWGSRQLTAKSTSTAIHTWAHTLGWCSGVLDGSLVLREKIHSVAVCDCGSTSWCCCLHTTYTARTCRVQLFRLRQHVLQEARVSPVDVGRVAAVHPERPLGVDGGVGAELLPLDQRKDDRLLLPNQGPSHAV